MTEANSQEILFDGILFEIKVGYSRHQKSRRRRWSSILSGLVYLDSAIQIAGISLTDRKLKPRIVPTPIALQFVGSLGLVISFAAPFLSLAALAKARSDIASTLRAQTHLGHRHIRSSGLTA
jgi:hypothetical protein